MRKIQLLTLSVLALGLPQTAAQSADSLSQALRESEVGLNFRYRLEFVDEDAKMEDALASTLRTNLWVRSGEFAGFSGYFELQNVLPIGGTTYNDTLNGKTQYPVVADPEGTEVNQAYIAYTGIPKTKLKLGRQVVNLGNQRFIGSVGFRQNDQTLDAAFLINSSIPKTTVTYGYVDNVNRIQGDDSPVGDLESQTHLLHVENTQVPNLKITVYGYWIDFEDMPVFRLSSATYGLRFDGSHEVSNGLKLLYAAEYARQTDHGSNRSNYDADYFNLEAGLSVNGVTAKVGYEELGSDDGISFQTPLATGHKFNGWADKFLSTPPEGLEDVYASLSYKTDAQDGPLKNITLKLAYHDFSSETGGLDYGTEVDGLISKKIGERYSIALKAAAYNADMFDSDTNKVWLTFSAAF